MKKLITKYQLTGDCEVNVDKVVAVWNINFSISFWKDRQKLEDDSFFLIKQGKKSILLKIKISREQAFQIIERLNLYVTQSSFFNSGKTYYSKEKIDFEISRISDIIDQKEKELSEKQREIYTIQQLLSEYKNAKQNGISS